MVRWCSRFRLMRSKPEDTGMSVMLPLWLGIFYIGYVGVWYTPGRVTWVCRLGMRYIYTGV
jgi:hypothetical protein